MQFGTSEHIDRAELFTRWLGICLCEFELEKMLMIGNMFHDTSVPWMHFFAIAVGFLNKVGSHYSLYHSCPS